MMGRDNLETKPITIKPETVEPCGRAVLPVSLILLLSARAPLPSEISCFLSTCISSDSSFPSVRQEPTLGPWKGSPFLQQLWCVCSGEVKEDSEEKERDTFRHEG